MVVINPNSSDFKYDNTVRRLQRKTFDIRRPELNACCHRSYNVADTHKFGNEEVDADFGWFLNFMKESNKKTKPLTEEVMRDEVDEDEDEDDKDPQYHMFLKELRKKGKFYELTIFRKDEAPFLLEYHEQEVLEEYDHPIHTNISVVEKKDEPDFSKDTRDGKINQKGKLLNYKGNLLRNEETISLVQGSVRQNKIAEQESILEPQHDTAVDACYRTLLDGGINLEHGEFIYEGKRVIYEENVTSSDSDVLVLDDVRDHSEVNNKHRVIFEKDPSLKEELMRILSQPYNQEEYEELMEYVEQQKPICRHLDLRNRVISSALRGPTKSVLDDVPKSFRRRLRAARHARPKALNLLRGFRFWLEHLPADKVFKPWLDKDCVKVLPSSSTR